MTLAPLKNIFVMPLVKTQHLSLMTEQVLYLMIIDTEIGSRCIIDGSSIKYQYPCPVIGEGNLFYNPPNLPGEQVRRVLCLPPCRIINPFLKMRYASDSTLFLFLSY